jgi:hypothetical protein
MTPDEFVSIIQRFVRGSSVSETLQFVRKPPGRRPLKEVLALSQWFNALGKHDQDMVAGMMRLVAHSSVAGMLCILDGVKAIESTPEKGYLELRFVKDGRTEILNPPKGAMLHELLEDWTEPD